MSKMRLLFTLIIIITQLYCCKYFQRGNETSLDRIISQRKDITGPFVRRKQLRPRYPRVSLCPYEGIDSWIYLRQL